MQYAGGYTTEQGNKLFCLFTDLPGTCSSSRHRRPQASTHLVSTLDRLTPFSCHLASSRPSIHYPIFTLKQYLGPPHPSRYGLVTTASVGLDGTASFIACRTALTHFARPELHSPAIGSLAVKGPGHLISSYLY